jgi:histidinol-phosphate phosphatase family protein
VNRAVFIDRDGTLVPDIPYLDDAERLTLFPKAAAGITRLQKAGFKVVMVTNQSGVGRGFFSEETLGRIHEKLAEMLEREGARLDGLYYCPHRPEDGCSCRKPATGMVDRASRDMNISLKSSYVVGDDTVDIDLARNAGTKSVLVLTGHGVGLLRDAKPDAVVRDISAAVDWILEDAEENE